MRAVTGPFLLTLTAAGVAAYTAPLPCPPLPCLVNAAVDDATDRKLTEEDQQFRCPGEEYPISRAVHLGRLASFYPGCRTCPFREETGSLSERQVKQLAETRGRGQVPSPLFDEGLAGSFLNVLGPPEARRVGQALGVMVRREAAEAPAPEVVVAGDGRPQAAEMVAAVSEGLRWAGCGVIDVGRATSPCAAVAIARFDAAGGVLVGNPPGRPETVGMKLWAAGPQPVSAGPTMDQLRRLYETPPGRPSRRFGPLRRESAEEAYLASLAEHYHALRPLHFLLGSSCSTVGRYIEKLTASVACEAVPCPALPERITRDVLRQRLHFGILIGDDGETAAAFDQIGRPIAAERLLLLLAAHLLPNHAGGTVVLEEDAPAHVAERIAALGGRVENCPGGRASFAEAMRRHAAILGGAAGRIWYTLSDGTPVADGLRTLTLLLEILSRSDRAISDVLDSDAPAA